MSNVNNIELNEQQVLGSPTVLLVGQRELREYANGKPTDKIIGMRFDVVSPAKCYEKFSVKIEGAKPLNVTDEAIAEACATEAAIRVRFENFKGKIYSGLNNTGVNVSCSATNIIVVPNSSKEK